MNDKIRFTAAASLLREASMLIAEACKYINEADEQITLENYPAGFPSLNEVPAELQKVLVRASSPTDTDERPVGDLHHIQ
jgi:hypothetical protein